jgi:hypothetical protein
VNWRTEIESDVESPLDDEYGAGKGHCPSCGAAWLGHDVCHCSMCHLTFTSIRGFDFHRLAGECRTADDLTEKGYLPNDEGQWRKPAPPDLHERLS